ncbi:lysis system i-spanin subunit Rz [Escherichia coli]|uniref:lysis system i-spanin subunit Rz n=1 Tax=Escherichia coli TaxID=562 RepID=UPI003B3B1274
MREAPTTSGVDNATGPRLADAAERDYFKFHPQRTVDDNAEAAGRGTAIHS